MKTIATILALCLGISTLAQAQRQYRRWGKITSLGLQAGTSYTSFRGAAAQQSAYKWGLQAGGFASFGINSTFAVRPGILYSQKGGAFNDAGDAPRLTYLDVPLLLQISTYGLQVGGVVFELGPQAGWLLAPTEASRFNDLDVGYIIGVGYQRKMGPYKPSSKPSVYSGHGGYRNMTNLCIGLRYNGGLTNIEKSTVSGLREVRNSAFQLYLAYSLNVKMP